MWSFLLEDLLSACFGDTFGAQQVDGVEPPSVLGFRLVHRAERAAFLQAGALIGSADHGTTKGLYAKDPDGPEFEVCWLLPADLVDDEARGHRGELDLTADIARYGADTLGACARVGA
jgi:hypothetical protein